MTADGLLMCWQGLLGVIPFNALTFTLLYLKQLGIDNLHASVIAAGAGPMPADFTSVVTKM